jgi:hypothetical protein
LDAQKAILEKKKKHIYHSCKLYKTSKTSSMMMVSLYYTFLYLNMFYYKNRNLNINLEEKKKRDRKRKIIMITKPQEKKVVF